jgi:ABC-2 type transport system permease protein
MEEAMRIFDLALKDIRQVLRDKQSLLFLVLMPVVFTFFFGFAFGGMAGDAQADNRLQIAVANRDSGGILADALIDLLDQSNTVRPVAVDVADSAEMDQMVLRGDFVAGLIIPQGFSAATLRGEDPVMTVIMDEETQNGQTMRRALQTNVTRLMSTVQAAHLSAEAYKAQAGFANDSTWQAYMVDAVSRAVQAWKTQPLSIRVTGPALEQQDPLAINPYNQFSPGMIVQFAIFGLVQAAMVMVVERRSGAMARMMTTPMTKVELISGHILAMFLIFFAQQLLLVLFGQFFLNVNYLREPLAVLLLMVSISLWVAALGLFISTLAKKEEHVIMGSMVAMFGFSALGGAWFSLEMVGKTFSTIGHLMPSAWAIDGYQNIILRGLGFNAVLLPVAIILAYALFFFTVAIWRFKV